MISDGDSKAHQRICKIYGESDSDIVEKLDCIGHVGKRMHRALTTVRLATKGKLSDGKPVGGRKGRLTDPVIKRLSELYRNAIRQNVDREAKTPEEKQRGIEKLKKNIMAVLFHSVKLSDPQERHQFCPEDSWCCWKRKKENVENAYHLDPVFLDLLKPTFVRLSESRLMERCLPGFSQNQNESFNSLVWKRAPKHKWHGPKRVQIAAYLAALHFNCGAYEARSAVMLAMDITPSAWLEASAEKKDKKRLYGAKREARIEAKKRRKSLVFEKQTAEASSVRQEETTYESGLCDLIAYLYRRDS